jgi:hypothetical protein
MQPLIWRGTETLLLTLWVGGLWTVGYLAVPVLFHELDDRALAGTLAGRMFTALAYLGLVAGSTLLIASLRRPGGWRHWRTLVLLLMLGLVIIGQFVLQPAIAELRAAGLATGSESAREFARLHGLASILYLVNSVLGMGLVLLGAEPKISPSGSPDPQGH